MSDLVNIPVGYRFDPSEEELVCVFLLRKVMGFPLPWNAILERDIYEDNKPPWEVFSDLDESSLYLHADKVDNSKKTIYVFTKLKTTSSKSKRKSRTAGGGTWSGNAGPKDIMDSKTGQVVGSSRTFNFEHSSSVGHWIMHEYEVDDDFLTRNGLLKNNDVALCKITRSFKENNRRLQLGNGDQNVVRDQNQIAQDWNVGGIEQLMDWDWNDQHINIGNQHINIGDQHEVRDWNIQQFNFGDQHVARPQHASEF